MSTQSILTKTIDTVQKKSEVTLLKNANNHILKNRFELGKGMKTKEARHSVRLLDFICTENVELIDYINSIIDNNVLKVVDKSICKAGYTYSTISDYTEIFEENLT